MVVVWCSYNAFKASYISMVVVLLLILMKMELGIDAAMVYIVVASSLFHLISDVTLLMVPIAV